MKAEVFDLDTITYNGNPNNRINLVYMGDGYTISEQDKFIADVTHANAEVFNTSPYSEYSNYFNVFAIKVISNESGAKHPNTASDCPTDSNYIPTSDPDNYFGSSFDRGGIHRLLTISNWDGYYLTLADNLPQYDEVVIMVNTPHYGGSGGTAAVASAHTSSPQLVIHEFGHSFGELGDEYDYGTCRGGEGPNYTQETDRNLIKWRFWIEDETPIPTPEGQYCNTIGLYEGAHYCDTGSFRPKCNCMMRSLFQPFCEVCIENTIQVIHNNVQLIESHTPDIDTIDLCDSVTDPTFTTEIVNNTPNTIRTTWLLDGEIVASGATQYTLFGDPLSPGFHQLIFEAADTTESIKSAGPVAYRTWHVRKGSQTSVSFSPLPEVCISDSVYLLTEGNPGGGTYVGDFVVDNVFFTGAAGIGSHTITYIYQDVAGCYFSASQDITVHPTFEINQTAKICEGESIMLAGDLRTNPGFYYDSLQSVHGCDSVIVTELRVNALPVVYLGNDTILSPHDTLVLDAGQGFIDYLWSDGSKERTLRIFNLEEGDYEYFVTVTNINNCTGSDTIIIQIESPESIAKILTTFGLEIFPNPTSGYLVIKSKTDIDDDLKISLIDNLGRIVFERKINELKPNAEFVLDLHDYNDGIYYLMINNNYLFGIQKIIKY